ncbi:MAG TPA: hypothetical protein DHU55_02680 [Blastocatellia bacterium]|jgi:hypothetical protein|nr:hypothetical protein [Blastocatellia bacterium]HCX28667.1 hypothetical protein [Blastocatellia bacterium]
MATSASVISKSRDSAISLRWIIGARDDLIWLIGSVASSYLLLILYVKGIIPLVPMVALWAILIDAPHVFGTFSRTYFDRTERHNRSRLLWGSLLFFVVGPIMVLAGAGLVFFFLAALWAYYHLVKQHYGFMVLYKKKNNDLAPLDNALDRLLLLFAFNYPFVAFIARDPEAIARVPATLQSGVNALATILLAGTIVLAVAWVGRQIQRALTGEQLNIPKYLLLAAAIPMHWVVLLTPMPHKPIAIVAILTIYHNLQYHRLIWFHNKKYTRSSSTGSADAAPATTRRSLVEVGEPDAPERQSLSALDGGKAADDKRSTTLRAKYGAAELISRRLLYYVAFGVLFGLIYQGPRQLLGYMSLKSGDGVAGAQSFATQLGISFLWGYAFIHYYLDSKIWRIRRDPSVGKALNMS